MKNIHVLLLLFTIGLSGCLKEDDLCESFFSGTIIDSVSGLPVPGAQVIIKTLSLGGFFSGDGQSVIDSIVTDQTGIIEVSSNESFANWIIIVKLPGHEDVIEVYNKKSCAKVMEDIELIPLAQLHIKTEDVPELQYDKLHIQTLPEINSKDSLESRAILGVNESTQLWLKPSIFALISYRLQEAENIGEIIELHKYAEPGEIIEITIKM